MFVPESLTVRQLMSDLISEFRHLQYVLIPAKHSVGREEKKGRLFEKQLKHISRA